MCRPVCVANAGNEGVLVASLHWQKRLHHWRRTVEVSRWQLENDIKYRKSSNFMMSKAIKAVFLN